MWCSGALGILTAIQLIVTGYAVDVFEMLKDGDVLLNKGDMQGALRAYSSAIAADPKSKIAYTKRAAASAGLGHLSAAAGDCTSALELEPSSLSARMQRAQLHLRMCKFDDAEKDFNVVLEAKPEHDGAQRGKERVITGRGHLQTAEVLVDSAEFAGADEALSRLNNVASDCSRGRLLAAKMYLEEGNYEKVSWEAGRLLKNEPNNVQALLMRGEAFFYLEEFEMAKRHFGEVITNYDPDNEEAKKLFKKAKKLWKDLSTAREKFEKTRVQKVEKKLWKSAEEPLEGVLTQIAPSHKRVRRELMIGLAQCRFHLSRDTEAIEEAVDEVLEEEFDEPTLIVKAEMLLKQGKYEQAHQTVKTAIVEHLGGRAGGKIGKLYQRTEQALKKSKMKDYYKILGVSPDLDDHSLKRAYRKLALQYHPDKVPEADKTEAEAHFAELNEAYEVLSDPEKKRNWEMGEDPFKDEPQQGGHAGGFHFHHAGAHSFRFNF